MVRMLTLLVPWAVSCWILGCNLSIPAERNAIVAASTGYDFTISRKSGTSTKTLYREEFSNLTFGSAQVVLAPNGDAVALNTYKAGGGRVTWIHNPTSVHRAPEVTQNEVEGVLAICVDPLHSRVAAIRAHKETGTVTVGSLDASCNQRVETVPEVFVREHRGRKGYHASFSPCGAWLALSPRGYFSPHPGVHLWHRVTNRVFHYPGVHYLYWIGDSRLIGYQAWESEYLNLSGGHLMFYELSVSNDDAHLSATARGPAGDIAGTDAARGQFVVASPEFIAAVTYPGKAYILYESDGRYLGHFDSLVYSSEGSAALLPDAP